jgi:hypothetical protein
MYPVGWIASGSGGSNHLMMFNATHELYDSLDQYDIMPLLLNIGAIPRINKSSSSTIWELTHCFITGRKRTNFWICHIGLCTRSMGELGDDLHDLPGYLCVHFQLRSLLAYACHVTMHQSKKNPWHHASHRRCKLPLSLCSGVWQ